MKIVILERALIMVATYFIVGPTVWELTGHNYRGASHIIGAVSSLTALFASIYYSKQGLSLYGLTFSNKYESSEEENKLYAQAEQECESGDIVKGLWSKAIVKAKGNEDLRKIEYMKLRVAQLKHQKNDKDFVQSNKGR